MIRTIKEKDIYRIYEIVSEQLGRDYIKQEALKELVNNDKVVGLVLEEDNEVLGFLLFEIIDKIRLKQELKTINKKTKQNIKNENRFGFLNIVAVCETAKGKGIGSALTYEIIKMIEEKEIKYTFSLAWKDKNKINIGNILLRAGFQQEYEIKNYYYKDSIKKNYTCPACGNPPCKCSAVVYIYEKKMI